MQKGYFFVIFLLVAPVLSAQYNLTVASYSQNFDGLGTTTSSGVTNGDLTIVNPALNGWYFLETFANANTTITAGTGSSATGDTYNFGAAANADRALGGLQTGSLNPIVGFWFTNNTGSAISSLSISYTGETWRVGAATRSDRMDFQYSSNATSLSTGTWTDHDPLDYANPGQATGSGSLQHSAAVAAIITGLNIANGGTFFIRWTDFDASGSDDGMGIDDLNVSATFAVGNTITTGTVSSPPFILANCGVFVTGTVDFISTNTFNAGNEYRAQLSDDVGSFSSPIDISNPFLTSTLNNGTITVLIPAGTVSGNGYRIRVVSTNPAVIGSASTAFTITQNGIGGCSSSHSDYYRSFQNGNWDNILTWESSPDNSNWIPATLIPTSLANNITIQGPHTVTIAANGNADQVKIINGATLDHHGGVFTLADGAGNDIDILSGGTLLLSSSGISPSFAAGSPTINVNPSGIVKVANSGLTGTGTGVNASNYVYQHQAILEYASTSPFSSSNVTFFPNVNAVTVPIFRTSNTGNITVGAIANTVINGIFECNGGGVSWQSPGVKIFRNGIRGTGNITGLATSGKFVINGSSGELGGSGSLTTPPANGLEIGAVTGTTLSVINNKTITGDVFLINTCHVKLGANNLTVTGILTGGTTTSYIQTDGTGTLTLNAVSAAAFPIGNTSYNPLVIANGGAVNYSVRVENGINPAIAFPTYGIDRTWHIAASAITSGVMVTFQYATADANAGALPQPQPMEVLQNTGGIWNISPGNINIMPGGANPAWTVTTPVPVTITNFPIPYAVGVNGGLILPLDCMINCQAKKRNDDGIISWSINNCTGVNSFELQRGVNGNPFVPIATITPVRNGLDYSYSDAGLPKGTCLYRLKVKDQDGAINYSNTAVIFNNTKLVSLVSMSPNPVYRQAMLTVSAARQEAVVFKIYNITGSLTKKWDARISEGTNNIIVDLGELPAGVYQLAVIASGIEDRYRFVKQ